MLSYQLAQKGYSLINCYGQNESIRASLGAEKWGEKKGLGKKGCGFLLFGSFRKRKEKKRNDESFFKGSNCFSPLMVENRWMPPHFKIKVFKVYLLLK